MKILVAWLALLLAPFARASAAQAQDKIIVSGASGQLGSLVIDELLARNVAPENLILVSRTPTTDHLKAYAARGASVRFGDFAQPRVARCRVSRRNAHAADQHQRWRRRSTRAAQGSYRCRCACRREADRLYLVRQRGPVHGLRRSRATIGARSRFCRTAAWRGRCCATRSTRTAWSIKPCRSRGTAAT